MQIKGNLQADGTYDKSVTINNGVTLLLPYGSTLSDRNNDEGRSTSEYKDSAYGNTNDTGLVTKVTLAADTTITILSGGTLEISGVLSGGGGGGAYAGQVGGNHARLVMGEGSDITCYGTIKCYGYIWEESLNNGSAISIEKDADIYMPLVVRDFKGGSLMYALYRDMKTRGYSPFNQLQFINVHPTITYKYGSSCRVWANLCTGGIGSTLHHHTGGVLIGTGADAFIQMTDATYSYVVAKYNKTTDIMQVDLYGGARTNALSLSLEVLGTPINVSSNEFIYALSWLQDIRMHKADGQASARYAMPQRYKMLPGSKLTIDSGVTLTIGTLTIYESFVDTVNNGESWPGLYPNIYPSTSSLSGSSVPEAKLIVNGSIIASNLGGKVYTSVGGAMVTVTGSVEVVTYEPTKYSGSQTSTKITQSEDQVFTNVLQLYYYDAETMTTANKFSDTISKGKAYISDSTKQNWSQAEYIAITIGKGWNVTITNALVIDPVTGKPTDANEDSVLDTYNPTNVTEGDTFYFIPDNNAYINFTLGNDQYLMKDGILELPAGTNPSNISQPTCGGTVNWKVTVSETVSVVVIPKLTFEGNLSKIAASKITYYDNGDGTCNASIYLEGNGADLGTIRVPLVGTIGRVNSDATTFDVSIGDGDAEEAISDGLAYINTDLPVVGNKYRAEYHLPYHWQNTTQIFSDTTITIS